MFQLGFQGRVHDRGFAALPALGHLFECDQIRHRADEAADHAAQALVLDQFGAPRFGIPRQGLASGVIADDMALAAADAPVQVVLGNPLPLQVEVIGGFEVAEGPAHQVFHPVDPLFGHEVGQAFDHILDDPVAVVDDAGGHLEGAGPQEEVLQGVDPGFDPADSGQGQIQFPALGHVGDKVQADGLDGRPGSAADGAHPEDVRLGDQVVQADF